MPEETGFFRGAGGAVFEMALPLSENMQNQVTRGELVPVTPDGGPAESDAEPAQPKVPAINAAKNDWVGYAVSQGMDVNDADAMTKNDLIEKFGRK